MARDITREGRELKKGVRVKLKGQRQRQRSRSIDISSINTHPNGPAELDWEIDQDTEVLADVWKENIPLTCHEEDGRGMRNGERTLEDDQTHWGYREKAKTES